MYSKPTWDQAACWPSSRTTRASGTDEIDAVRPSDAGARPEARDRNRQSDRCADLAARPFAHALSAARNVGDEDRACESRRVWICRDRLRRHRLGEALRQVGALFDDLKRFISARGVEVRLKEMKLETPGVFDGPTITINPKHDQEAASFYLAHSFGSISQWSTTSNTRRRYSTSCGTQKKPAATPSEKALKAWRLFEQTSSDHAVWVLDQAGHADAIARVYGLLQSRHRGHDRVSPDRQGTSMARLLRGVETESCRGRNSNRPVSTQAGRRVLYQPELKNRKCFRSATDARLVGG